MGASKGTFDEDNEVECTSRKLRLEQAEGNLRKLSCTTSISSRYSLSTRAANFTTFVHK